MAVQKIALSDLVGEKYAYFKYLEGDDNKEQRKRRMQAIMTVIDELKPDYRRVINLYYFEGLSMTQIAKAEGLNKSTICRKIHRAQRAIRSQVRFL